MFWIKTINYIIQIFTLFPFLDKNLIISKNSWIFFNKLMVFKNLPWRFFGLKMPVRSFLHPSVSYSFLSLTPSQRWFPLIRLRWASRILTLPSWWALCPERRAWRGRTYWRLTWLFLKPKVKHWRNMPRRPSRYKIATINAAWISLCAIEFEISNLWLLI